MIDAFSASRGAGSGVTTTLRVIAVLLACRGIGNLFKRFGTGSGLVVFGQLWPPDTLLAPILGALMLAYGYGLWTRTAWALPLGVGYALFASANLLLFPVITGLPPRIAPWMYGIYGIVGLALSWGAVWLLIAVRRDR